jgi:rhodanese-related sulfurtransferase
MATTTRPAPIITATPAQLAAYFAAKLAAELGPHNVKRLQDAGDDSILLLDVRKPDAFREGHVPTAQNIPFEELPARMAQLPKAKTIITYCWDITCILSTKAAFVLASEGFHVKEMLGGMEAWTEAGFHVER